MASSLSALGSRPANAVDWVYYSAIQIAGELLRQLSWPAHRSTLAVDLGYRLLLFQANNPLYLLFLEQKLH
jgi:hypothetical protein